MIIEQITFEDDFTLHKLNIIKKESADTWKCSQELFRIDENKTKDKLTGYSFYFDGSLVFKINVSFDVICANKSNIEKFEILPTEIIPMKAPKNFVKCSFSHINFAIEAATTIVYNFIKDYEPTEHFGCCSLYEQCSDARRCLHNDLIRSKSCFYKKNLESGKIFYGINKNL